MDARMTEYARLLVEVGLNVQKGQTLVIRTPLQCAPLARCCAGAAYDIGCREVIVDFTDSELTRMKYLRAEDAIFDEYPSWLSDKMNMLARGGAAFLSIAAQDPDMLQGVAPDRIRRANQAGGIALQEYQSLSMRNMVRWCVASAPVAPWAKKVFPQLGESEAIDALWNAIYQTMQISGEGDAVAKWQAHTARIESRARTLSEMRLTSLHYRNSLGTDLTIGLPEGAIWAGGAERSHDGVQFVANMPTEEVFTAPHRDRVNGRVVSSMPFVLDGTVINRFAFTFENGRIAAIEAETPEQYTLLENAIHVDEGASYLGEVALVPFDSPISKLGILFYNTLFDENASCHLAFGKAYPCLEGAETMDEDALKAHGINDSFTHKDFMIGTRDLSITGQTKDGQTVAIFVDGNFAF